MSDDDDPGGDGTGGVPPDVRATLDALLSTVEAVDPDDADGDPETALSALDTAATVVENKVPDPDERERLAHGCERARTALSGENPEPALAAEYARSLRARL